MVWTNDSLLNKLSTNYSWQISQWDLSLPHLDDLVKTIIGGQQLFCRILRTEYDISLKLNNKRGNKWIFVTLILLWGIHVELNRYDSLDTDFVFLRYE